MRTNILKTAVMAAVIFAVSASAQTWNCGANGSNVTATLDANGTLTISGSGAMADYQSPVNPAPWYADYNDSIVSIVIEDGVTSIGDYAFTMCSNLTSATIANSVTSIGRVSFTSCKKLEYLIIPNSVTSIGDMALQGCHSLKSVTIGSGVTSMGYSMFSGNISQSRTICLSETPPVVAGSLWNVYEDSYELYVPLGAIGAYRYTSQWENFWPRIYAAGAFGLYTVKFDAQGGSAVGPQSVPGEGGKAVKPADPVRYGYVFNGWQHDFGDGSLQTWNFDNDLVYADMTLIAKWAADPTSIATADRVIPNGNTGDVAIIAPLTRTSAKFTVGPNPVSRERGYISFLREGKRIKSADLTIYSAFGRVVRTLHIIDAIKEEYEGAYMRIGYWDLKDKNGRPVPAGLYLIRGKYTYNGKDWRVLVILGVK